MTITQEYKVSVQSSCGSATLAYTVVSPQKVQYLNVGDPSATPPSYTHTFGAFTVSPAGCPIVYSIAIKDKNNAAVTILTNLASFTKLSPDTSVDVKVGPSTDPNFVTNSPYILTISATP